MRKKAFSLGLYTLRVSVLVPIKVNVRICLNMLTKGCVWLMDLCMFLCVLQCCESVIQESMYNVQVEWTGIFYIEVSRPRALM